MVTSESLSNQRNRLACEANESPLACKTKFWFLHKMESNAPHATRYLFYDWEIPFSMNEQPILWVRSEWQPNLQQHEQQQRLTKIIQQVSMHLAKEKHRLSSFLVFVEWKFWAKLMQRKRVMRAANTKNLDPIVWFRWIVAARRCGRRGRQHTHTQTLAASTIIIRLIPFRAQA